ncbi:hypothetical protein [Azospirillum melinis]
MRNFQEEWPGVVNRYPALVTAGGVLLGWIAGDLAVSDPLIAGWVDREAVALAYATPLAAAIFFWAKSRTMVREPGRQAPAKPAKRMAVPAFPLPASASPVPWTIPSEPTLPDRYGGSAGRATAIPGPAAVSQSSGSRVKLFIYAVSAITVAIGIYLIGALGSAFTIIHQSTEHARQTIADPSCPETVLSANRGVDPVTLNRLVAQCRIRALNRRRTANGPSCCPKRSAKAASRVARRMRKPTVSLPTWSAAIPNSISCTALFRHIDNPFQTPRQPWF